MGNVGKEMGSLHKMLKKGKWETFQGKLRGLVIKKKICLNQDNGRRH
jgi:hypothetical protein